MTAKSSWDNPEDLFADDPQRAAGLTAIADALKGAANRPWAVTIDVLTDLVRTQRDAQTASAPLAPATSLLGTLFEDIAQRHEQRKTTGCDAMGHSTGFPRLDSILGGLDRGRMSVMLAAPGAGKTTASNQIAYDVAASGASVLYVSFENTPDDLILKQIARLAGKSANEIRRGRVDPADLKGAYQTFAAAGGRHLYYVEGTSSTTVETIRTALVQFQRHYPDTYPLVVVDFLQRLATTTDVIGRGAGLDDMRGRVGLISQQLRGLANESGAHIWAISSTNRAAYNTDKATPGLASGRESGDIEFAADHVITLAPGKGESISMTTDPYAFNVVKNRHGETGLVNISRERHTMRMVETDARVSSLRNDVQAAWKSVAD